MVALDQFGNGVADFSGVSSVEFTWADWPFNKVEFDLYNVYQSAPSGVLSMLVSVNGGSSYDTASNYKSNGMGKWAEGVHELASTRHVAMTQCWWPVGVDMGDSVAYGTTGMVTLWTPGTAGGSAVHSAYESRIVRTDSGLLAGIWNQGGHYTANVGSKINGVKFIFHTGSSVMSGKIVARGIV